MAWVFEILVEYGAKKRGGFLTICGLQWGLAFTPTSSAVSAVSVPFPFLFRSFPSRSTPLRRIN
jgi:hypothetical protein